MLVKKKSVGTTFLALLVLLLISPDSVLAQRKSNKEKKDIINTLSFLGVHAGGGYSLLMHTVPHTTAIGGGHGLLGVSYYLRTPKHFTFEIGAEAMFLNSCTRRDDFSLVGTYLYNDPVLTNHPIEYHLNFTDFREQHNAISVGVPIMFGGEFKKVYFALGAKVRYSLHGFHLTRAVMTTTATDPEFIDQIVNVPTHNIDATMVKSSGGLNFGLDVAAAAEVGLVLDEWMPRAALGYGQGRYRRSISYRIGLYADFGVLNINANSYDKQLAYFPGADDADGVKSIPATEINSVQHHSLLDVPDAKDVSVNPLTVGVKFSIGFQLNKTKYKKQRKSKKKKTEAVSSDKPQTSNVIIIYDAESGSRIKADVTIQNTNSGYSNTLVATENRSYTFDKNIPYPVAVEVTKEGYRAYRGTISGAMADTLRIELNPVRKNTVFILENLYFDTDKSVIKDISTQSLIDLYQMLRDNPDIRIRITGHTDNVGSSQYNKRLSDGRARAVYDEMVRRGISPSRMTWEGKGESDPIDTNSTEEGRAVNRRVEIKIL